MAASTILGMIPAARNEFANPSAEVNTTGLTASNVTLTSDGTYAWVGSKSFKNVITSIATVPTILSGSSHTDAQRVQCVAGNTISVAVRAQAVQANRQLTIQLQFFNDADVQQGSTLTSAVLIVPTIVTGFEWGVLAFTEQIAPAGTTYVRITFRFENTANVQGSGGTAFAVADTIYLDGIGVRKNAALDTYVDGSLGALYSWVGTAHLSASVRAQDTPKGMTGRGGVVRVSSRIYASTILGAIGAELTPYISDGVVSFDVDRDIHWTLSLALRDVLQFSEFSWVMIFRDVYEEQTGLTTSYPAGLFRLGFPTGLWPEGTGSVDASDVTVQLLDTVARNTYNVAGGTIYTTAIAALLVSAGITRFSLPTDARTVPTQGLSWPSGTTYLEIVNTLLAAIGYYSIYMLPDGTLTSMPFLDFIRSGSAYTYSVGQEVDLVDTFESRPSSDSLYNYVIVTKTDANQVVTQRFAENSNPAHRYSTVALGLLTDPTGATKVYNTITVEANNANGATALQAIADSMLARAAMIRYVALSARPVNQHAPHELIDLDFTGTDMATLGGRYYVEAFSFGLAGASATYQLSARRSENTS